MGAGNSSDTPANSQGATGSDAESSKSSPTPIIVGVVVGVVGGALLLALAFWMWRRHRRRRQQRLAPEPFTAEKAGDLEHDSIKGSLQVVVADEASDRLHSSGDEFAVADAGHPTRRIEEDTGSEIVEFLPPQYFDPLEQAEPPALSPESPDFSASPDGRGRASSGAGGQEPALKAQYRQLQSRPSLKDDYKRVFGRRLPRTPTPIGPRPLKAEYKAAFGGGGESSSTAGRLKSDESFQPPEGSGNLRHDYKKAFGDISGGSSSAARKS